MKKIFSLVILMQVALFSFAQNSSIQFERTSFDKLLKKAVKEKKLIFIDAYTEWCAPCKRMEKEVFILPEVAEFYNATFINAKFDMEKGEGIELAKRYEVGVFPTYLFINEKGELVHREVGYKAKEEFLAAAQRVNNPEATTSFLMDQYKNGERSIPFLLQMVQSFKSSNRRLVDSITKNIADTISDKTLLSPLGWTTIQQLVHNEQDRFGVALLLNHHYYKGLVGVEEYESLVNKIALNTLYRISRTFNDDLFQNFLKSLRQSEILNLGQLYISETGYYLDQKRFDDFKLVIERMIQEIPNDDHALSFVARRVDYVAADHPDLIQIGLELAQRAVFAKPDEYSNQSTLAKLCLTAKEKERGLKAARKSRILAEESTSKIQKIADDLIKQLEALP